MTVERQTNLRLLFYLCIACLPPPLNTQHLPIYPLPIIENPPHTIAAQQNSTNFAPHVTRQTSLLSPNQNPNLQSFSLLHLFPIVYILFQRPTSHTTPLSPPLLHTPPRVACHLVVVTALGFQRLVRPRCASRSPQRLAISSQSTARISASSFF